MRDVSKTRGVALIMALTVVLLLSIALMKTFENRSVETAHLANTLQKFQAESLSRSVFRAILLAIKTKGLVFVSQKDNKALWQGVPIFLNNGQYFQINTIEPMDQLFNLNRPFRPDDSSAMILRNIVNRHKQSDKEQLVMESSVDEIYPVLSALNDWTDIDDAPDTQFLYNNEIYQDQDPEFIIKNRKLDQLSEVQLIPAVQTLGFNQKSLKETFRVETVNCVSENVNKNEFCIDLNLAEPEAVENYLLQFKDVEQYPNLYHNAETIRGILEAKDEELPQKTEPEGFYEPEPRFPPPLYKRGESDWEQRLRSANIELNTAEQAVFSAFTKLLRVKFAVTSFRATVTTEAILEVTYQSTNTLDITNFTILQYTVR